MIVAPSILSADFTKLLEEVKEVNNCGATFLHIDVMDGHFVPNISMGPMIYKNLKGKVDMLFDVHLMITDPMFYSKTFVQAGADLITFHYEAVNNPQELIDYIKSLNVKVGISIKPNTKVEEIIPYLTSIDLVLVMSVEPGFGGQSFIPSALDKIAFLHDYKKIHHLSYLIEVDGGINYETAKMCKDAGVDVAVAGTYIFKAEDRTNIIKGLLEL